MLGIGASLLGSVASGVMGMFGQKSANDVNIKLAKNRYQYASSDMQKAGLNPAMMFGSGSASPMPTVQNEMAAPADAIKDAASSASQIMIANKTIDNLTSQIAKTNADTANVKAALPSIRAGSDISSREAEAIKGIPDSIYTPIVQSGYGADKLKATGKIGSGLAGAAASAKSVGDGVSSIPEALRSRFGLSGDSVSSASHSLRDLKKAWDEKSPALWAAIQNHLKPYPRKNTTVIYKQ